MASRPIYLNALAMEVLAFSSVGEIGPVVPVRLTLNNKTFQAVTQKLTVLAYTVHVPYSAPTGWADRFQLLAWATNNVAANAALNFIDQFGAGYQVYLSGCTYPVCVTPALDGPTALYQATIKLTPKL